jgi:hypothetical protein
MSTTTLGRRIAASIVIVIVAVWSTAMCVAGATSHRVSHGCCAKSPQQGLRLAGPRQCCAENSPNYFGAIPVAAGALAPSVCVVVAVVHAHDEVASRVVRLARADADTARPPGPPAYVLISSFRI